MIFRSQQRLIIILSVDVDEDRGDAAENGEIDDPSVDPGDALARGLKISGENQVFFGGVQCVITVFFDELSLFFAEAENQLHQGSVVAFSHEGRTSSAAQGHADRLDDDRFSGACFTCYDIEARFQIDIDFPDDGKVFDIDMR